jgi:integrase
MARKLKDADLGSPTGRTRLKARRKPYWRLISAGQHIGYRRHQSTPHAGTWVARFYLGGERYAECVLAAADDALPADGLRVLDFRQAQDAARAWFVQQGRKAAGVDDLSEAYTVEQCLIDYLTWYSAHRKAPQATRHAVEAHILPTLGAREVGALRAVDIKKWLQGLAATPPRLRSAKGAPPRWRSAVTGPEGERKRKATANRILSVLKAALNMAFSDGRVPSDAAWRRVKPFKGVDSAKIVYLAADQAARLVNACERDFRRLVHGALLTGCRYGELTALRVGDVREDSGSIHVRESKSSKPRHVYLSDEAAAFFRNLAAGREDSERLFLRADGSPWGRSEQVRRMADGCRVARIEPAVSFHVLRHTYASHYLMNGGPLPALASQLGHADTRMTIRHYAHLADSWRAAEARQHGPRLFAVAPQPCADVAVLRQPLRLSTAG